jgi:hypothetical protein
MTRRCEDTVQCAPKKGVSNSWSSDPLPWNEPRRLGQHLECQLQCYPMVHETGAVSGLFCGLFLPLTRGFIDTYSVTVVPLVVNY